GSFHHVAQGVHGLDGAVGAIVKRMSDPQVVHHHEGLTGIAVVLVAGRDLPIAWGERTIGDTGQPEGYDPGGNKEPLILLEFTVEFIERKTCGSEVNVVSRGIVYLAGTADETARDGIGNISRRVVRVEDLTADG